MKLTPESVLQLEKILATCALVDIDTLIIEHNPVNGPSVRGVNENKSCVIISSGLQAKNAGNIPTLSDSTTESLTLGLSRLSSLNARLSLFKADPETTVNLKENDKCEVSSIDISSPTAKVQFRCTSPALIKAPKKINDIEKYSLILDRDQIPFILSGAKAMSAKRAVIVSKKDGTFFEFTDTNQDTFSIRVADAFDEVFAHHFPADVFLPLLRAAINNEGDIILSIGEIGTVKFIINGYPLTILPQVQE